ncbi:hypothetical protein [Levilactobacillus yiduensis]|uniref:hypothetical protein n=1 Tax=Levilactobacillus yiduensis TaxID=2953880 RepID=UPI000EF2AB33|nr:hypothetical protein [Levilactobacillus yiduensis]AYM02474.1 hypothetical protein D8911_05470 [Levilactobacillus brevis]
MTNAQQYRDVTRLPLDATHELVIACDSSAGIGLKQDDQVTVAPTTMAAFTIRVPLLELLCLGAQPFAAVDTVGNEMLPTGQKVIQGIRSELALAGLADLPLNGSTEDNMTTLTTSVGVTLLGKLRHDALLPATTEALEIFQLGQPYVGNEVVAHLAEIFSYESVRQIRAFTGVQDMLPVGSKGMGYEIAQISRTQGHTRLQWLIDRNDPRITASAGPATVVVIAVRQTAAAAFAKAFPELPRIARLEG